MLHGLAKAHQHLTQQLAQLAAQQSSDLALLSQQQATLAQRQEELAKGYAHHQGRAKPEKSGPPSRSRGDNGGGDDTLRNELSEAFSTLSGVR